MNEYHPQPTDAIFAQKSPNPTIGWFLYSVVDLVIVDGLTARQAVAICNWVNTALEAK